MSDCKPCTSYRIPRPPQMKGLHMTQTKRHLFIGIGLAITAGFLMKYFRNDPRKKAYAEFYKNYNDDEAFRRMDEAGLMQYMKQAERLKQG